MTASKAAGVPHTLVLSVANADITSSLFGRQFAELETFVKRSGITYTLLRLPMFTDNLWYVPWYGYCAAGNCGDVCRGGLGCVQGSGGHDQVHRQVLRTDVADGALLDGASCVVW